MIPVILQVHVDRGKWVDVPVTPETTCRDVIECCREPGDQPCRLVQNTGSAENAIPLDESMMDVLGEWGEGWPGVAFHLQYGDCSYSNYPMPRRRPPPFTPAELMEHREWNRKLPENGELSLSELRQMAARQQNQIEAHQQLLVAKEQRLKFLKQQEVRHQHHSSAIDADRLRHLREKVELQELKLRRLRALRGQVEQHRSNNTNLSAELESIRALFNEKEKELSLAVAKVEELTRQLEDVRRGDMSGLRQGCTPSPAALEFQKLRRELLYRSKLNEQQNARIAHQRETLAKRQSEISQMDQRIAELQQRLQRKRLLNQQLSSQLHAASRARPRSNIAAVEPLKRTIQDIELIQDDLKVSGEPVSDFTPNKKDPKYQTLPYNTKFTGLGSHEAVKNVQNLVNSELEKQPFQNGGPPPYLEPPANRSQGLQKPSPPHGLGNLSPRPFGSTYSTSLLSTEHENRNRQQSPLKSPVSTSGTNTKTTVTTGHFITSSGISGGHRSKPLINYQSYHAVLPPTVMTTQLGSSRTVPQTPARLHPAPNFCSSLKSSDSAKPVVPPKPSNPVKPIPPPRQTHCLGTMLLPKPDTVDQALSVLKGSNRSSETSRSKLLSMSTQQRLPPFTQKENLPSDINRDTESDSSSSHSTAKSNSPKTSESANINISLNRRIGMPPAFFFPENQTPPSDLHIVDMKRRPFPLEDPEHKGTSLQSPNEGTTAKMVPPLTNSSKENSGDMNSSSLSSPSSLHQDFIIDSQISPASTDSPDKAVSEEDSHSERIAISAALRRVKKGNLKTKGTAKIARRVSFDPLALLLDAALEGELELVKKTAKEVPNPSAANDEGITALHNAICAGHFEIVKFLVEFGCDVNAQDSDGWTPLHCAASCNNLSMVKYLVERGACIFATTLSDHETAAEKCEEEEEGFDGCSEYLYSMQEKLGILNNGVVYALYGYESQNSDELSFQDGDQLLVLRKGDDLEREWWWSKQNDREGYIPRNLLGLYSRVTPKQDSQ